MLAGWIDYLLFVEARVDVAGGVSNCLESVYLAEH